MMAAKVTPMAASRASVASAGRTPRQACAVTTNVTVDAMMKPAASNSSGWTSSVRPRMAALVWPGAGAATGARLRCRETTRAAASSPKIVTVAFGIVVGVTAMVKRADGAVSAAARRRSTASTRACSASRNWRKSAPGRKRSSQPFWVSACCHAALRATRVTRTIRASRSASDRPGGATMARQLARSRATPDSRSVGALMPGRRAAAEMASGRNWPAAICPANSP